MGLTQKSSMGLADLRGRMAALASPALRLRMSTNLAEEARTQVANGFRGQRDPYGRPWEPTRYRKGMILQDTGRLRASVATHATPAGFRIDMPVVYAAVHQYGATIKAHTRAGGVYARGGKARANATRNRKVRIAFRRAAVRGAVTIPQRQMIPMSSTGGLGPIWTPAFDETARALLDRCARGKSL